MTDKKNKFGAQALLTELVWTLLTGVITFLYCMVFLLIFSFVFQWIVDISLITMFYISVFCTLCMIAYRVVKYFR